MNSTVHQGGRGHTRVSDRRCEPVPWDPAAAETVRKQRNENTKCRRELPDGRLRLRDRGHTVDHRGGQLAVVNPVCRFGTLTRSIGDY